MELNFKDIEEGLSWLLRYSYGGFLLLVFVAYFGGDKTKGFIDRLTPSLTALSALVIGAGIYVFHRSLVIPCHHLILCGLFYIKEGKKT